MSILKAAANLINKISLVTGFLAGLWVAGMTLVLFYSVVSRRVFNSPLIWDVDFSEIAMVVMVYLGVAYTTQIDGHVAMDAVYMRLKAKSQNVVMVFVDLMIVLFAGIALWQGWQAAAGNTHALTQAAQLPQAPGYIMIPIGVVLLLLQALVLTGTHIGRVVRGREAAEPSGKPAEAR